MPFSLYAAQQAQARETGDVWLGLIRVKHPDLVTMRFAVNTEDVVSNGDTYTAMPIADIQVPDSVPGQTSQGQFVLDAVDQTVLEAIDSLEGALRLDIEIVLSSFEDDVLRAWLDMRVEGISSNGIGLTGALRGAEYAEEMAPWLSFVPLYFPRLFP